MIHFWYSLNRKPIKTMTFRLIITVALVGAAAALPWIAEPRTDAGWVHHHESLQNLTRDHGAEVKVVFLGDSITEGWAGNGKAIWTEHYATRGAYNYGIGGDRTEHILYRLETEFDKVNPKLVVLKIGTNNLGGSTGGEIALGIWTILEQIHVRFPQAQVLLLSVLPRNSIPADTKVHEINGQISKYADNKKVFYLDLTTHFETKLATEKAELYVPDGVHLSAAGYEEWYKTMEPLFVKLLAGTA